jgi:hypothetical protein
LGGEGKVPRTWSRDSPIVLKGDLRRTWGFVTSVWLVVFIPTAWWLVSHPEGAPGKSLIFVIMVALFPFGLAIDYHRRRYRVRFRVTEEGVAIESGSSVNFDRFAACSAFRTFFFALRWKAEVEGIVRDRGVGPWLGLSRNELRSLCAFLNSLREQALAK